MTVFCATNDNINKGKRQLIELQKIFANIFAKGLMSRIYLKKLLQLNYKKIKIQFKNEPRI